MEIVSGFNRKCKDAKSGVNNIWLLKYKKYNRSQIVTDGNYLISFPETFIYEFDSVQNPAPSETMEQNEGGKFYNQSISLTFPNSSTKDIKELASLEFRLLFKDRNGLYRIFGLYNGLSAGNVSYTTGGNKSDLNGIKIDFTGQEEHSAYFISNPAEAGFIDLGTEEPFYFLYQNEDRFLLQDSNFLLN